MTFRPLALLALLVITSAMPLAAAAACESMPLCHQQQGERMAAPMACCEADMRCAPEPVAQPNVTAADARVALVAETVADAIEPLAPRVVHLADAIDSSPPPPTRLRLAQLATLLI